MRILRGLSSRLLACGCLAGVYETYEGSVVTVLDSRGPICAHVAHTRGALLPDELPPNVVELRKTNELTRKH